MSTQLSFSRTASVTADGNLTSDTVIAVTGITLDAEAACEIAVFDGSDASGTLLENLSAAISTSRPVTYAYPLKVNSGKVFVTVAGSGRAIVHYLRA